MSAVRRVLAVALIVGLLALVGRTYFDRSAAVCREELGSNGTVQTVCGPVGLEDVPFLSLALFAALIFLLPDFGEIAVPGIATLRRRVDQTERRQEELSSQITQLSVQQMSQSVNLSVGLDLANQSAEETVGRIRRGQPLRSVRRTEPAPARSAIESDRWPLLREWDEVYGLYALARHGTKLGVDVPPHLSDWANLFEAQLETLYALAQVLEHHPERLSPEDVSKVRNLLGVVKEGQRALETRSGEYGRGATDREDEEGQVSSG